MTITLELGTILYMLSIVGVVSGWASVLFGGMAEKKPEWLWVGGGAVLFVVSALYFVVVTVLALFVWVSS